MTDEYIPRKDSDLKNLYPESPREKDRVRHIKEVLQKYVVKGSEAELEGVALEIWREIKR